MTSIDYTTQTVLITDASSGIGASFDAALAARGSDLILVARRADRLESLAAELATRHGITATPMAFDLGSPTAGADLHAAVAATGLRVTSIINNAGFGTFGPFL